MSQNPFVVREYSESKNHLSNSHILKLLCSDPKAVYKPNFICIKRLLHRVYILSKNINRQNHKQNIEPLHTLLTLVKLFSSTFCLLSVIAQVGWIFLCFICRAFSSLTTFILSATQILAFLARAHETQRVYKIILSLSATLPLLLPPLTSLLKRKLGLFAHKTKQRYIFCTSDKILTSFCAIFISVINK